MPCVRAQSPLNSSQGEGEMEAGHASQRHVWPQELSQALLPSTWQP